MVIHSRGEGEKQKREEREGKGKNGESARERDLGALGAATVSENPSVQTRISNGGSEALPQATRCLHRCVGGTEETGGSTVPLVLVPGRAMFRWSSNDG